MARMTSAKTKHDRGQHGHADELDQGRGLAGLIGHREAGADDLGDIVDCAAQEDAGRNVVELEQLGDRTDRRSWRWC